MPQYQGVWSLQQQMQALTSGQWATDPLFDYTTLLLQGDAGANGAQNNVFYDTSPNQFAITRNGNTTQGTFSPFSATGWSNYFDGSGDYISMPSATSALALGSGDWTIECFVNVDNLSSERTILDILDGNSANRIIWRIKTSGLLAFQGSNGTDRSVTTTTVPTSTWVHLAICKASGTTRMFINGVQANSNYTDSNTYANSGASTIGIIASDLSSAPFLGYISNFRVVKGTALYTANFTPSPTALTAVTNTSLLTCQSNRFIDNSTNALSLTIGGNTSVQAFSPFAPQFQYTASVTGGSGYFDGTGDYLYAGNNAAFTMGTGDFTYECWAYHTSISGQQTYFARTNGNFNGVYFYKDSSGFPGVYTTSQVATSSVALTAGQWYHLVATRLSGTLRIFINGVQTASVANTTNMTESVCYVGGDSNATNFMVGYITGARILKGTGYSSITVPTAPVTSIANTSLLLNFTNAGILDGTMKNNLETVGNAQVSTSVVKYGSGSMYFDGSGDGLVSPISKLFDFGSGNFTIEFWANCVSTSGTGFFASVWEDSGGSDSNSSWLIRLNSGTIITHLMQGGATYNTLTSPTISTNTWFHFAWVRNGNTQTMYINGIAVATGSVSGAMNSVIRQFRVGYQGAATNYLTGYIDDFRITNGIARYTQNFIPPSVALPRQ